MMLDDSDENHKKVSVEEFRANLLAIVDDKLHEFLIRTEELERRVAALEQANRP